MSFRMTIEPTVFVSVRPGKTSFGFRAYDENVTMYHNLWGGIPNDDFAVLAKVIQTAKDSDNEALNDMLEFVKAEHLGLYIGEIWYEWDEIKDVMEEL